VVGKKYYYDMPLSKQYKHNKDIVEALPVAKYGKHKASYSEGLIQPFIEIYSPPGGMVFDPFLGTGTSAFVAQRLGRQFSGCELSPEFYQDILTRLEVV
jgi:DNA modification methylase